MTVKDLIIQLLASGDMDKEVKVADYVSYFDGKITIQSSVYDIKSVKSDSRDVTLYIDNYNHFNYKGKK